MLSSDNTYENYKSAEEEGDFVPYSDDQIRRINIVANLIAIHKSEAVTPPTYRDSPYLKEIAEITLTPFQRGIPEDQETLEDAILLLRYLAEAYDNMGRAGMSVKFYKLLLSSIIKLTEKHGAVCSQLKEDFFRAAIARNYYVDDDCKDLIEIITGHLSEEEIEKQMRAAKEVCRHSLRNDPVETTEEYLAVIDEVEQKIAKSPKKFFCFGYWSLKAKLLAQKGISWTSPEILNPDCLFEYDFDSCY